MKLKSTDLKPVRFAKTFLAAALVAITFSQTLGQDGRTPAPADARVYIISPVNGDTVESPVTVRFGLSGMGVAPAATDAENTGHHHLLVDAKEQVWRQTNGLEYARLA